MKLTTSQLTNFLQKPDPNVRVALVYGPDSGLVRERAEGLAQKVVADLNDPFRVTLLSGSMVNEGLARLYDEAASSALGGGRRLVRVQQALEGNAAALKALLDDLPPNDSFVLVEAGDLDKRSKLRALCEGENRHVCAIPCYVEDAAQRQRTIAAILQAEGLSASRAILALLADALPPDRGAMRRELDKLALYAKDSTAITLEHVRATIQNAGAAEIDDLIHAVANGEAQRAALLLDHLFAEQTSSVALLRAAQRHFLRLQLARSYCEKGLSASDAVGKLQPKVFWKHVEPMARQVQRWPAPKIEKLLKKLCEAEAACKRTGTPDAALCSQIFLQAAGRSAS